MRFLMLRRMGELKLRLLKTEQVLCPDMRREFVTELLWDAADYIEDLMTEEL